MKNLKVLLVLISLSLVLVFQGGALAGELYGVKMDDKITVDGKELVLNGMGLRSVSRFGLKIKVYVIGLYLPEKMTTSEAILKSTGPKVFKMVFKRNVDSEDIEKGWKTGFTSNCGEHCAANEDKIKKFNSLMSDMRTNQMITVTVYKDKVEVDAKGRRPKSATIEGEEFARIVEKIWLGPKPPNEELKSGLLGKSS